jgi:hypothetical protein
LIELGSDDEVEFFDSERIGDDCGTGKGFSRITGNEPGTEKL